MVWNEWFRRHARRGGTKTLPLVVFIITVTLVGVHATGAAEPKAIPARRHLFLDPTFIEQTEGVQLRVNPADCREVVIRTDRPWEKRMISLFLTVRDEGEKLRLWYICRDGDNQPNVAYAESTDGIKWTKPNLGLVEYAGSHDNNLVGISSLEGVVYRDPQAASEEERYIYVSNVAGKGIVRFVSPDGLRWREDQRPLMPFRADTQNVTFWDEREGKYVMYLRGWDVQGKSWQSRLRKVVRLTADRLDAPLPVVPSGAEKGPLPRIVNEVPTVFAADEKDPPNSDVYNLSAQPYPLDPRWYVGFPSFLLREASITDGRLEAHFVGSTDGITWHFYDRAALRPAGHRRLGIGEHDLHRHWHGRPR